MALIPVILVFVYEKEIKSAIITEINTHLKAKVYINPDNIDLTILRTFPKAALVFKDVTVMGALEDVKNDTLLHAQSIYLLFNAKDIWNKKYEIQQIRVLNADLNMLTNKEGDTNYDIWESAADSVTKTEKNTSFKLEMVSFSNFNFSYKNSQSKIKTAAAFKEVIFSGNFTDKEYVLDMKANGYLDYIKSNKRTFIKNKNLIAEISAQVKDKTYTITNAEIGLNKLFFTANGWISNKETETPAEITFKGKNIDVQSILSWMPDEFHNKIKDYKSESIFYSDLNLKGNLGDYNSLDIKANFGTSKASVAYTPTKTTLTDISFTGSFVKEKFSPELLSLKEIKAHQGKNFVSGEFSLSNFASPYLKFKAEGNYNLADFFTLVPVDTIASAKGMIDFNVEGNINLNDAKARQIASSSAKGKINLKEIELVFKNGHTLKVPGGEIGIDNENLETKNLAVKHGKSSIEVSGRATNFLNYILKPEQPLLVDLEVKSPFIDVDDFILPPAQSEKVEATENKNVFNLRDNISANLKLEITDVVFRTFKSRNLQGSLEIKNKKLLAKNLSFEAFGGDITLTGVADASKNDKLDIKGSTNLVDVNIKQMFTQLNNFGQSVIDAQNLNGKATTQVDFSASWNGQLQCDLKSIEAAADLSIVNGELIDYKLLEVLAEYVQLKELRHVKFSNLLTHVDIKNQTVYISKTSVKNSALDIEIYGSQTFDYAIDYRVKLRLSDWLAKRPGKNKQLDEELMETENDPENKRCVFIHMTGTIDKPVITYDRKAMKQKIKEDLKEEKKTLKKILNEEFGWFKKDTTINKKDDTKKDQKFKIDFNREKKEEDKKKKKEDDEADF
ncbi:MAG TPA: AsmA-like C-terminal region-containing protein [Bacteroidia bacterium]|nr:AsmA-like C-terminal region-containing protein [Bacteroidia bacterium]